VAPLIRRVGWKPSVVAGASRGDTQLAEAIARLLGIHPALAAAVDPQDSPLIVTIFNGHDDDWAKQVERLTRWKSGLTFALAQSPSADHAADIAGRLGVLDRDLVARAAGRAMELDIAAPDVTEATALLLGPQSPWRLRLPE
jgi:sulfur transfer complex TusBCD TusB component (DsrH family)